MSFSRLGFSMFSRRGESRMFAMFKKPLLDLGERIPRSKPVLDLFSNFGRVMPVVELFKPFSLASSCCDSSRSVSCSFKYTLPRPLGTFNSVTMEVTSSCWSSGIESSMLMHNEDFLYLFIFFPKKGKTFLSRIFQLFRTHFPGNLLKYLIICRVGSFTAFSHHYHLTAYQKVLLFTKQTLHCILSIKLTTPLLSEGALNCVKQPLSVFLSRYIT